MRVRVMGRRLLGLEERLRRRPEMRLRRGFLERLRRGSMKSHGVVGRSSPQKLPSLLVLLTGLALGCQSNAVPSTPPPPPGAFWPEQAALDLAGLERIDDRSSGSRGARAARRRLRKSLEASGIETEAWKLRVAGDRVGYPDTGERELVTLVGRIPGESPDIFMLAADYDTAYAPGTGSAGQDASGAAVVLALGRALVDRRLPYTVWLVFIDGDSASLGAAGGGHDRPFSGSAALVERLAEQGELERVRLAVFFRQVAGERLEIARDLHSHRAYREVFFDSARDLGHEEAFGAGGRFVSGATGHRAFLARDLRQVVAITGSAPSIVASTDGANGQGASPEPDSAVALGIVGDVTLEALDRIAARLQSIDRFAEAPLLDRGEAANTGVAEAAEAIEDPADAKPGAGDAAGVERPASDAD